MGVNGLWTVLQPCARPTNLATLNRKRLAVDASIWIYQFLKAVRDKEGNALRNSHVVGFFRRICKLLWYGILPVFVFDGGAPSLKRATLQGRRRRREGRRDDAVRTAGKLLAVQMKRIAEEDEDKRRQERAREKGASAAAIQDATDGVAVGEALPSMDNIVYADEAQMSKQERQKSRKFYRQDAYHLPEMENGIEAMGRPDDPRIMSIDELEEYARQFHDGEDINLYDFSKIDFDGEFFKSLPAADRYNILNAARIRSRLRMGLSKEQLEDMFPDRMAFSRFQIERVKERNHLTQRLMFEAGMTGTDLTMGVNARVAGEKDREYILVKNEGAEGGWALGVVSKEKDRGEMHKPIDVDALQFQYQAKEEEGEWEDEDDFEDVPIEGLNRLPKLNAAEAAHHQASVEAGVNPDSMFVDQPTDDLFEEPGVGGLEADEDEDLNRAIAMSLQNQHGAGQDDESAEEGFEDVPAPEWEQKAVAAARPISGTRGRTVANIVNSRANAAVPKRRESSASSDSDVDLGAALAAARKKKAAAAEPPKAKDKAAQPAPVRPNVKNPFDGPLPFEKLDWKTSIFEKKPAAKAGTQADAAGNAAMAATASDDDEELAGGFEKPVDDQDKPRPLPPWMVDNTDIRESLKKQQVAHEEMDAEDRAEAEEQKRLYRKYQRDRVVEIDSSDDGSDVEIVETPTPKEVPVETSPPRETVADIVDEPVVVDEQAPHSEPAKDAQAPVREDMMTEEESTNITEEMGVPALSPKPDKVDGRSPSPEDIEFEDVEIVEQPDEELPEVEVAPEEELVEEVAPVTFEDAVMPPPAQQDRIEGLAEPTDTDNADPDMALFAEGDVDEFSDLEEEELLVQMAEEAEEHARFASTLNHKSTEENQEAYERELRALRTQQKKDRRDADEVTQIMVTECQTLLRLFGIPYITAPMEAEAQCAELVRLGLVDGIVTDDSDIFLFGGTRVYKNMFNDNKFVQLYLSTDLEKELSLSREQLIAIAQLLGSDYTEGLHGVGPVTAVEILSEFPGPDGLAEFRDWWNDVQKQGRAKEADAKSAFRRKFRKSQAAKLFLPAGFPSPAVAEAYLQPEVDKDPEQFRWGVPDLDALRTFLMGTIGWSQERTDEVLVPVIKDMNRRETEGTQSNITRFYGGSAGTGAAKEVFAPRQRAAGKTKSTASSRRMAEAVSKLRSAKSGGAGDASAGQDGEEGATGNGKAKGRKRKARNTVVVDDEDVDDGDGGEDGVGDGDASRGRGKKAKASA